MEAADELAMGALLLEGAQRVGAVQEVFGYRLADGAPPEVMASSSEVADAEARVRLYTRRFHKLDPAAQARASVPANSGFARAVNAKEILQLDYRTLCFERPGFAEKLCFGWRLPGQWLGLNFYRRRLQGERETAQLSALANVALTAMQRRSAAPVSLALRLERKLARHCPELTRREREVCARTLAGASAQAIAEQLGIGAASVLTYRQRAYQRLQINHAGALLERLID